MHVSEEQQFVLQVTLFALTLGIVFGACAVVVLFTNCSFACTLVCLYLCALVVFHVGEFVFAAFFHFNHLSIHAFLLHNPSYNIALTVSLIEHVTEGFFLPWLKEDLWWLSVAGGAMVVTGQIIRTIALWTAGVSFTHHIAKEKEQRHKLVTTGIYHYIRHPGYCGWFLLSVGTQVMLVNPISSILFLAVTWVFFNVRIFEEEKLLVRFFGDDYDHYARRVWSGIPLYNVFPIHQLVSARVRQMMMR